MNYIFYPFYIDYHHYLPLFQKEKEKETYEEITIVIIPNSEPIEEKESPKTKRRFIENYFYLNRD